MKRYTIKSTSKEGIYYLVSGWRKANTFWLGEDYVKNNLESAKKKFFTRPQDAKTNLTKLLKVMDEYKADTFELVEF